MERLAAARSTMLEREAELAELAAALAAASAGHGQAYLVSGDPGIGKTTLVRALAEAARPTDVGVVWGRCWENGGAPAYWPWTQVLRALTGDVGDAELRRHLGAGGPEVAQLVPELKARLGIAPSEATVDAQGARFRLFEAVSGYLSAASGDTPLLIILEDLHAADEASLSLLQFLSRHLDACPLMVVGTYRTAEAESSPQRLRLLLGVAREGAHLTLSGLGRQSVAELVARTAGMEPGDDLVGEVHETTEGNPFFVGEVARMLGATFDLRTRRLQLPEVVQAVIRRRLQDCERGVTEILGAAAVIGRVFDLAPLEAVTGRNLDELLDVLGAAARLRVVEELRLNEWSFIHALMRETLYEGLPLSERVQLHRAVAEAFEATRPSAIAEIAHHRFEAARSGEELERAVDACQAAGDAASVVLAFEEAAGWYERALEVLERTKADDRRRCQLHLAAGEALLRGGSRQDGRDNYERAAEIAQRLGDGELLAHAALGFYGNREDDLDLDVRTRVKVVRQALALLPDKDSGLRARLLMTLATLEHLWDDVFVDDARAAVDMARRAGDKAALAEVLWHWHFGHSIPAHLDERMRVADELVSLVTEGGSKEQLVLALQWRIYDRFEAGDMAGMRADFRLGLREAEALRLPFPLWGITDMRVTAEQFEGRFEDADRTALAAVTLGRRTGFPLAELRYAGYRIQQSWAFGRFEEMAALAENACEKFPTAYVQYPMFHAIALAELSRRDEAAAALRYAFYDSLWAASTRGYREPGAAMLAEACSLLGVAEPAATLVEVLAPFRGRNLVFGVMGLSLGLADRYLGLLATLERRYGEAEGHFEAAHSLHEQLGAPWWLARGWTDHARMLLARGQPGDDKRAAKLLAKAKERFDELGATVYSERIEALLVGHERTVFRPEGAEWDIRFDGSAIRLRNSKGLHYLAHLLREPGRPIHALDLAGGRPVLRAVGPAPRLLALQSEIEEARADHDLGRLEEAEAEFDELVAMLQAATETPEAERARQSVTRAVRGAIDRIAAAHPGLGEHFRSTVRTGVYSTYRPDPRSPIRWET